MQVLNVEVENKIDFCDKNSSSETLWQIDNKSRSRDWPAEGSPFAHFFSIFLAIFFALMWLPYLLPAHSNNLNISNLSLHMKHCSSGQLNLLFPIYLLWWPRFSHLKVGVPQTNLDGALERPKRKLKLSVFAETDNVCYKENGNVEQERREAIKLSI